jgi:hypothetical protein
MGRLEKEARDERVRQQMARQTVYTSLPYQTFMVHAIKAPMLENLMAIISPEATTQDRVKAMLRIRKILELFNDKFPEPQIEIHPETGLPYVWHPNSELLIKYRDEFFTHCHLGGMREKFLRMGINFLIIIYDYDPPYRMMIDWWAERLIQGWRLDIPITVHPHAWAWWTE